jgi:hypothetical protein
VMDSWDSTVATMASFKASSDSDFYRQGSSGKALIGGRAPV